MTISWPLLPCLVFTWCGMQACLARVTSHQLFVAPENWNANCKSQCLYGSLLVLQLEQDVLSLVREARLGPQPRTPKVRVQACTSHLILSHGYLIMIEPGRCYCVDSCAVPAAACAAKPHSLNPHPTHHHSPRTL